MHLCVTAGITVTTAAIIIIKRNASTSETIYIFHIKHAVNKFAGKKIFGDLFRREKISSPSQNEVIFPRRISPKRLGGSTYRSRKILKHKSIIIYPTNLPR